MASQQFAVLGQYQACAIRAIKLQADCTPADTPNNVVVAASIASGSLSPELKEAVEVNAETACGVLAWYARTTEKIKAWNLDLSMAFWDYELLSLIVGGRILYGDNTVVAWSSDVVGWASPGFNSLDTPGVGLEIYSKVAFESGECPTADITSPPAYVRHIFPKLTGQLSDRPFEADQAAFAAMTCRAVANPKLWLDIEEFGPEWPTSTTIPNDSAYVQIFATQLPTFAGIDGGFQNIDITPGS
jgi:hypothetical protein